jgi:hypothetical protein
VMDRRIVGQSGLNPHYEVPETAIAFGRGPSSCEARAAAQGWCWRSEPVPSGTP